MFVVVAMHFRLASSFFPPSKLQNRTVLTPQAARRISPRIPAIPTKPGTPPLLSTGSPANTSHPAGNSITAPQTFRTSPAPAASPLPAATTGLPDLSSICKDSALAMAPRPIRGFPIYAKSKTASTSPSSQSSRKNQKGPEVFAPALFQLLFSIF
jgi:hypothetical protein